MKKFILLLFVFQSLLLDVNAQIHVKGQAEISAFPSIEFVLHNRNPEKLSINDFKFFEVIEGNKVEIDSVSFDIIKDTLDYSKENKCVLIIVEALNHKHRYEQIITFFNALENSIEDIVNDGDKVKIVAFSLRGKDTKILKNITSRFTDDIDEIKEELDSYRIERNDFTNKMVSEIMGALVEGIELLSEQGNSLPKSILLLSEELQNSKTTNLSANDVTELAKDKNVVINTIKYNRSNYYQHVQPTLSVQTYGVNKAMTSSSGTLAIIHSSKADEASSYIVEILDNSIKRAAGISYSINLHLSNYIKDARDQEIVIEQIDSKNKTKFSFKATGNWVFAQFQKNLLLASGISFLILLLIAYLIYFLISRNKKAKHEAERLERVKRKVANEQEAEILQQKQELLTIKNKEEQKIKAEQLSKQNELKADQEKALIAQMKLLGALPILKYYDDKNKAQFEINKPCISVGRDEKTNQICIPNNNFSRNHFSIIFSDNKYKVVDNNSLNGMIINGFKLKEAELNNGDIIEIADVTFTFYI